MTVTESPLKKYRRQPKIQIDLPSQGKWYPKDTLHNGSHSNLSVFSMTANDEVLFKTPDALFNGESTANVIKSCIPAILDPWSMPMIDIDTVLVAIRIASYGPDMNVTNPCPSCNAENTYAVPLSKYIDHYAGKVYTDTVTLDNFTFYLRPLTYKENTANQKRLMQLRRSINYVLTNYKDDEAKQEELLDGSYKEIAQLSLDTMLSSVKSIVVDGETEEDKKEIFDFFENNDRVYFNKVKQTIEKNINDWASMTHDVKCESCEAEHTLNVSLDQSDFFALG